ncbi:MAG: hypothetical protein CO017_07765, partial [Zetaproteobacteria bacterium CG_4_8_14_3_um_filter_59_5]
ECSRDGFIGHCLTMLSELGMTAGGISLSNKDVVAFDAQGKGRTYTVVISLADDSLASRYFYFLGIWRHMDVFGKAASLPELSSESDTLHADFQYEAYFSDAPLQYDACDKLIAGEMFAQQLYEGQIYLYGNDQMKNGEAAGFVLAPLINSTSLPREEVQHALYSLRNLMALRAQVMRIYRKVWDSTEETDLYGEAMNLLRQSRLEKVEPAEWDGMVCDSGDSMLRLSELSYQRSRLQGEIHNLSMLFESIIGELKAANQPGMSALWPRMRLPFEHATDLLDERTGMLRRTGKQCEIILQLLHSRMLARQQVVLDRLAGVDKVSD